MTGSVVVRDATADDAVAIQGILNALIETTTIEWTEIPHTIERIHAWMDAHPAVLVADDAGSVVGLAAYGWFRDAAIRPGYRFTVESTVHVRESHWGTGLGRRLMLELIERARVDGLHTMVAAVDGENDASVRFHEQLGFVEVGRMPQIGEKFGRWLDLVLLQLRLDDRPTPHH